MRPAAAVLRVVVVLLLAAALAFFALRTSPYLQYIPWLPKCVGVWADSHGILRNTAAFWALGVTVFLLVGRSPRVILALCAFGAALEVAQRWIPGRVFDWMDIAASIAGVLLAWPIAWLLRRPFDRLQDRSAA